MKKTFICLLLAAIAVSAQQNKQRVAVLPSVGDLDPQKLILLTDKVREIATKNLPRDNFNILKQDVIIKLIGEEELYRSCKEGVCIGDLAKKTNANYGARCDVIRLDNRLVLKFELYSVDEEAIFETFTDYGVKDFYGMLASLEKRLPGVFKEMVNASKSREVTPKPEPIAPMPPAPPLQTIQLTAPVQSVKETKPGPPPQSVQPTPTTTTFTDNRDGKVYKKVEINGQVWMAENLNYAAKGSKCYENKDANCAKYGRLYNWETANKACPAGYHLPSDKEWATLVDYAGGKETAGTMLKSSTGWNSYKGIPTGTNKYGWSALPGGYTDRTELFYLGARYAGYWWSATESNVNGAWHWNMNDDNEYVVRGLNFKTYFLSVRCVKDE